MRFPILFFLFLLCLPLAAQEKKPLESTHIIPSAAFGDDRKITVYLPPNYYNRPDEQYTITYVLDGHYDPFIDLVTKTIEYNTNTRNYIPTIVVGIHAKSRGWEFSTPVPGDEDDEAYEGGRAPELQRHLQEEVIPFVEKLYPDARDFKALIGHSSGGAFVLYTLFSDKPDIFDGYIAISPALRPGENKILEAASARLSQGTTYRKFLYASAGSVGEREDLFGSAVKRLDAILKEHPNHGLLWHPEIFDGQDHFTVVPLSVNGGMLALTRDFRMDEYMITELVNRNEPELVRVIDEFYLSRQANYGFQDLISAFSIRRTVDFLNDNGKTKAALKVAAWGQQHYPDDYFLSNLVAEFNLGRGDTASARKAFEKSLEILNRIKSEIGDDKYTRRRTYLDEEMTKLKE
jgi:predicted alpha/beta superfamily hydrolase